MSKRALLPQQESVAVATLVIINKNDIIQQLSESLYINTIYIYIYSLYYIFIYTSVQDLAVSLTFFFAALLHHPQHLHAVVATNPFWITACCHSGMAGGSHETRDLCQT